MDPVKKIGDATSISLRSQRAFGFSMPPIVPFKQKVSVASASGEVSQANPVDFVMQCPISLGIPGEDLYKLPFDPILECKGSNRIKERYVAKNKYKGSIKEWFTQNDNEITISGMIIGDSYADMCEMAKRLIDICERGRQGVDVVSDVLNNYYNIWKIAIYDWDIPFTPGLENQFFSISAKSDDVYDLLVEVKEN